MSYKVEAWPWCADYCKKNKHSPYDSYFWDKAMLEYRRQHNIFEVGDIVIINGHESVYQIQYVYESACGYGMYQGRRFSHSMIERHATDEEIAAKHRL